MNEARTRTSRNDILSAAASIMRRVGYAEMSLRDLAAEVNMKAGSLYYHFPAKDYIVTEVMRIGVEVIETAVREELERFPDAAPQDRIMIAVRVHLDVMLKKSDFVSSHIRCYPFVPTPIRDNLREVRRSYDQIWLGLVRDYLGETAGYDDVRYLRHVLVGALNGALEWFNPNHDSASAFAAHIETLIRRTP
ncbi:MAG: TetR/AcrR family transcriptional regulator [Rhodobacterales bacterium]